MLKSAHNDGVYLSAESEWTDFMNIRQMRDGTPALLEYVTDEFSEISPNLPYHLGRYFADGDYTSNGCTFHSQFSINEEEHFKEAVDHIMHLEDFTQEQIEDPSRSEGFIWEFRYEFNWYHNGHLLTDYFKEKQKNATTIMEEQLVTSSTISPYPFVCKYSYHIPCVASDVSEMMLDTLEQSLPWIDHFGIFHIRRGDAIGECDTSLSKISNYLTCSLDNLEVYGKTSILFISDEKDVCYRKAIQDMVETLGFHFIDLDELVKNAVLEYAESVPGGSRFCE